MTLKTLGLFKTLDYLKIYDYLSTPLTVDNHALGMY